MTNPVTKFSAFTVFESHPFFLINQSQKTEILYVVSRYYQASTHPT